MKKLIPLLLLLAACGPKETTDTIRTIGSIERLDPALDEIMSDSVQIEIIADSLDWSEGPVWVPGHNMLLFSDVPTNIVYKWTEEKGKELYLNPSGFTGEETDSKEQGSNGLLLNEGRLILCQHGNRQLAVMNTELGEPGADFTAIADHYDGKRFNSPNDVALGKNKSYYMTDPPYGLGKGMDDPQKEIPFQGVYQITPSGNVILLVDSLTRPNGIALSPDNKYLYVANSDPAKTKWYRYELADSSVVSGSVFYDATALSGKEPGGADGFKVDSKGNIYASGPGGIWIFNSDAKVLGKIKLPNPCSNTALSDDEKTLYITNDMYVLRMKLRN